MNVASLEIGPLYVWRDSKRRRVSACNSDRTSVSSASRLITTSVAHAPQMRQSWRNSAYSGRYEAVYDHPMVPSPRMLEWPLPQKRSRWETNVINSNAIDHNCLRSQER